MTLFNKTVRQINRYGVLTCKIREVRSPIMNVHRGWECLAVVPNKARYDVTLDAYVTSYGRKYQIASAYVLDDSSRYREWFAERLQSFPLQIRQINWEG